MLLDFLVGIRKEIKPEDKKIGMSLWSGKAYCDYLCEGKFHQHKTRQAIVMLRLETKSRGNLLHAQGCMEKADLSS